MEHFSSLGLWHSEGVGVCEREGTICERIGPYSWAGRLPDGAGMSTRLERKSHMYKAACVHVTAMWCVHVQSVDLLLQVV